MVYDVEEVKESGETCEKLHNIYCSPYIVTDFINECDMDMVCWT